MAAERETPTELGIPLPLVPIADLATTDKPTNWHHHFHPRADPLLTEGDGIVIRTARLQRVFKYGNHAQYHQHFTGPELPKTDEERFRVVVLAWAGFIPEHGILTRGSKAPDIVALTQRQRNLLSIERQARPGSCGATKLFLARFVLGQDLSGTRQSRIDEFLYTKDLERKRVLGGALLGIAIERAVSPLSADYRSAWQAGRIPHTSPPRPYRFVANELRKPSLREVLSQGLGEKLAA